MALKHYQSKGEIQTERSLFPLVIGDGISYALVYGLGHHSRYQCREILYNQRTIQSAYQHHKDRTSE